MPSILPGSGDDEGEQPDTPISAQTTAAEQAKRLLISNPTIELMKRRPIHTERLTAVRLIAKDTSFILRS
jgi:hypothetical protein